MFNASGLQDLVAQYGDWFSYTKNPRAQIFQRDQSLVEDMNSMVRLIRWVSTLLACVSVTVPLNLATTLGLQVVGLAPCHPWGNPFLLGGGDACPGPRLETKCIWET